MSACSVSNIIRLI